MFEKVQSALDPAGPHARAIDELWSVLLWSSVAVWVIVVAALGFALLRRRESDTPEVRRRSATAIATGAALTIVTLFILLLSSIGAGNAIASLERPDALTIDVISQRWWWEVRYPGAGFETANEIHIPTGVPVRIRTTSADVIHSVWIPRLGGKIDSMPGHTTDLWLQADMPGVYRGQCAEFCGVQHAKMALLVIAQDPDDYARWELMQAAPAATVLSGDAARGRDVFLSSGCASCHAVRGDPRASAGDLGPDLTHLASRRTLAAATIPNTRGHLGGWISDPQATKEGNLMPATRLPAEELEALLEYLEGLR